MRRCGFVLAFAVLVAFFTVAASPAKASWISCGPGQPECATAPQSCQYWGNFYNGWLGDLFPLYDSGARPIGMGCTVRAAGTTITIQVFPRCDTGAEAGMTSDAMVPGGCSQIAQQDARDFGQPLANTGCGCMRGDPMNLVAAGNLFEQVVDYQSSGSDKFAFVRSYNSGDHILSSLGVGWRSNFDSFLEFAVGWVEVVGPDGHHTPFYTFTGTPFPAIRDTQGVLTTDGATIWTFTSPDDEVRVFAFTTGRLLSVTTRGGYRQTLAYDGNGHLASVTDSYGRSLRFTFANGVLQTMTDPDGRVYSYGYDTAALLSSDRLRQVTYPGTPAPQVGYVYENTTYPYALTGVIDEDGNRFASWSYDATMRVVSSQHAGGTELTTVSFNMVNMFEGFATVTNPLGQQTVYTLLSDDEGSGGFKVVSVADQATATTPAATESIGYDGAFINSITDRRGITTNYTNDTQGQVLSVTEAAFTALARTTSYTYHPTFHVPTQIVAPGRATTLTYDSAGRLLTKTETDTTGTSGATRSWSYTWSATGQLLTATDPLNATTTYAWDATGALSSITNALGQTTQVTSHDASGRVLSLVDANGITTNLAYDARGRLISSTVLSAAGNATTTIAYDPAGNVTQITRPDGSFLAYTWDAAHRLTAVSDALGGEIQYTLDAMGDRTQAQILSGGGTIEKTQSQVLDALGRVIQTIGAAGQTTSLAYDNDDNRTAMTDPLSNVTNYSFDPLNRLIATAAPLSNTTNLGYDAEDHETSVTDPRGLVTSRSYDGLDDLLQLASPDTGVTAYQEDAAGHITQKTDAAGNVAQLSYDALGRITARTYPNDPSENITYRYDEPAALFGTGRLTSASDESGGTAYVYDDRGNVVQETRAIGGGAYVTLYAYDLANHVTQVTYPSGRIVTYSRDATGRIAAVTTQANGASQPVTVVSGAAYLPFGPLASLGFGNGLALAVQYDQDYQPGSRVVSGTTTVQSLAYGFDGAGDITGIADNVTSARSQAFQYDALDRLTQASGVYGTLAYGYDAVGNRTAQVGGTGNLAESYAYANTSNQLLSVSNASVTRALTYTATGNLASSNNGGTVLSFAYDQQNRLVQVANQSQPVAGYLHNFLGQRVAKNAGGAVTVFHYDRAGHLIAESDSSGNLLREHIWMDDLPVGFVANGSLYFVHPDHLGTPQRITDGGQSVVWDAALAPFGAVAQQTGALSENLRFPGQYADAETGFNYNYFRDYDPSIGRYVQSDPIGFGGGVNQYGYALGDPINFVDSEGLHASCADPTKCKICEGLRNLAYAACVAACMLTGQQPPRRPIDQQPVRPPPISRQMPAGPPPPPPPPPGGSPPAGPKPPPPPGGPTPPVGATGTPGAGSNLPFPTHEDPIPQDPGEPH